eukprot:jgi/Botrbrau1/16894/Bobra.150_2s0107.1
MTVRNSQQLFPMQSDVPQLSKPMVKADNSSRIKYRFASGTGDFQSFAILTKEYYDWTLKRNWASLPGCYSHPHGDILIASIEEEEGTWTDVGSVALRPVKTGLLAGEAQLAAKGYKAVVLDTLERLTAANKLYAGLGFEQCAPYYRNPLPGVIYWYKGLDVKSHKGRIEGSRVDLRLAGPETRVP